MRGGKEFWGELTRDGKVCIRQQNFDTLSGAARKLTGKSNNGWDFWQVKRDGEWHELGSIRRKYLEDESNN